MKIPLKKVYLYDNSLPIMNLRSNALLRYKTIDTCLRDPRNKYTLKDLMSACSEAMRAKGGRPGKPEREISVRTLQMDLQFMRNKKYGYGAPIIVYERKYYKYGDPFYTIRKAPLKRSTLDELEEIIDTLRCYGAMESLSPLKNPADILSEEFEAKVEQRDAVVSYEGKRNFVGLEYFNVIHDAILNKKALCIGYHSSRSNNIMSIIFYPMYLKEYKGRWYALGYKDGLRGVYKLPLDRIRDYSYSILPFPQDLLFDPREYFRNIIGVTRLSGDIRKIRFIVKNKLAPFIRINPLHRSQQTEQILENGDVICCIEIIPNQEFYYAVFEYQPHIQILSPRDIGMQANALFRSIQEQLPDYDRNDASGEENHDPDGWGEGRNLFSDL